VRTARERSGLPGEIHWPAAQTPGHEDGTGRPMKPLEGIRQALGSIRANKLRSFLTMLGVIIGVSAMLLMVAVVEGFQTNIRKQFEGLGSRLVFIFYNPDQNERRKARRTFEGLRLDDAQALRERCDLLSSVAAEL